MPALLVIAALSLAPSSLLAAFPDGGIIRREIGDRIHEIPDVKPVSPLAPPDTARQAPRAPQMKISVKKFTIRGATLFTAAELEALVALPVTRELTLDEMQDAARKITNYYAARGWLAQALIPAQDVARGVVTIQVIEAKLGTVEIESQKGVRLRRDIASAFVTSYQPTGEIIRIRDLETGLLLLQDTPGARSSALIRPGSAPSTVDALITLERTPLLSGSAGVDNFGGISTGEHRANASLNINSPTCVGDRLSLKTLYSEGINYSRALYTRPIHNRGTSLGISASALTYRLGGEFAALSATGQSTTAGAFISHPLILNRNSVLFGTIGYDYRLFVDESASATTSDKSLRSCNASLSGSWYDTLLGGGFMSAVATLTVGAVDLSRMPDLLQRDLAGPGTNGQYEKVNLSLSRTQQLVARSLMLTLSCSGQLASGNLDSSEKFILGGPDGVRAYSTSEGAGDEGLLASAELRSDITPAIQLSGFFDYGLLRQYVKPWPGWTTDAAQPNTYSLNGIGVGLRFRPLAACTIKTSLATRLAANPAAGTSGMDHDGTKRTPRFWIETAYTF